MGFGAPGPHHVGVVDRFIDDVQSSGRLTFSLYEIEGAIPTEGRALEAALRRRAKAGLIARIAPRTGFFVIVPPEHRSMGCPPVEWWLDDLMRFLATPYYVGLLSAATLHGSAHFAVMETQVVAETWLKPIRVGRVLVRFFQKTGIGAMPIEVRQGEWGPINVATPETTVVDLLRSRTIGLDRVALTLAEMNHRLDRHRLAAALEGAMDVPTAQRLGYVLDRMARSSEAKIIKRWLDGKSLRPVTLQPGLHAQDRLLPDALWQVRGTMPEGILA